MSATDTDTDRANRDTADDAVVAEFDQWLTDHWNPDLTCAEWWDLLGTAGWSAPMWPVEWYGKGVSRAAANRLGALLASHGALGPPGGLGLLLAGPTIVTHGSDEQRERFLQDIVTGRKAWCQLFSEPVAGSDLAGLQTRAVKDGDEWVINGQKVWTSGGQVADLGMLIARTDSDVPKHQGITYFAFDMHQDAAEVRPLREMTGRAMFNEVFLEDARVADSDIIGGLNNGWAVANTTLANERAGLGAGGGNAAGGRAVPGTVAGNLEMRAGDFTETKSKKGGGGGGGGMFGAAEKLLTEIAKSNGKIEDQIIRQDLMRLHSLNEIARMTNLRMRAAKAAGKAPGPEGNIAKLSMSRIIRLARDLGMSILGPAGTLHAYNAQQRSALDAATGNPFAAMVTEMTLFAPGPSIYGGTDEIQHNIIGERVLGLPKEPNTFKTTSFKDLPKNG